MSVWRCEETGGSSSECCLFFDLLVSRTGGLSDEDFTREERCSDSGLEEKERTGACRQPGHCEEILTSYLCRRADCHMTNPGKWLSPSTKDAVYAL